MDTTIHEDVFCDMPFLGKDEFYSEVDILPSATISLSLHNCTPVPYVCISFTHSQSAQGLGQSPVLIQRWSIRTLPSSGQGSWFKCEHVVHLVLMKHKDFCSDFWKRDTCSCAGFELQRYNIWSCCCHLAAIRTRHWEIKQSSRSKIEGWKNTTGFWWHCSVPLLISCLKPTLPLTF